MNYNDYIISGNNEFLRDFDRMYREVGDPWGQQARGEKDLSFSIILSILKSFYAGGKIVDIGCGPGHLSSAIIRELKTNDYIGCDISHEAIKMASEANPEISFDVLNIITESRNWKASLVLILKTLYYCAPEIDQTILNIHSTLASGGLLAYSYNIKEDSFTKRYLDIEKLRDKLDKEGLFRRKFIADYYLSDERIAIDIYEKI